MTFSDLVHAVLLWVGLGVGIATGSHHGPLGAMVGAGAGLLAGHLLAVGLTVVDLVFHGIGRRLRRRRPGASTAPRRHMQGRAPHPEPHDPTK